MVRTLFAAEENELTFDPDDIITNIDQLDEVRARKRRRAYGRVLRPHYMHDLVQYPRC